MSIANPIISSNVCNIVVLPCSTKPVAMERKWNWLMVIKNEITKKSKLMN